MSNSDGIPLLLNVREVAKRWKRYGITEQHVRRLARRKILRASTLRKCPLLFPLAEVERAERAIR